MFFVVVVVVVVVVVFLFFFLFQCADIDLVFVISVCRHRPSVCDFSVQTSF